MVRYVGNVVRNPYQKKTFHVRLRQRFPVYHGVHKSSWIEHTSNPKCFTCEPRKAFSNQCAFSTSKGVYQRSITLALWQGSLLPTVGKSVHVSEVINACKEPFPKTQHRPSIVRTQTKNLLPKSRVSIVVWCSFTSLRRHRDLLYRDGQSEVQVSTTTPDATQ